MKHYHIISRIAIYMLSIVLVIFGIFHFLYPRDLLVYVPVFLVGGIKWAYIVGGAFVLVGLSFLTNQFVKFSSYLLVILLIIFILTISAIHGYRFCGPLPAGSPPFPEETLTLKMITGNVFTGPGQSIGFDLAVCPRTSRLQFPTAIQKNGEP